MFAALLITVPGATASAGLFSASPILLIPAYGLTLTGAGYLLLRSLWDSQGTPRTLALMVIVFAALLPEFLIDALMAWKSAGPQGLHDTSLMLAALTGANRLLIGLVWPVVVILFYLKNKREKLKLDRGHAVGLSLLLLATLYTFNIYMKGSASLTDALVLGVLFIVYVWRGTQSEKSELAKRKSATSSPDEAGIGRDKAELSPITKTLLFGYGAFAIFLVAEPLVDGLLLAGRYTLADQFTLVQWAIPLASKAPWIAAVGFLAWRGRASFTIKSLLTFHMVQWAFLVGLLPLVVLAHSLMLGDIAPLTLDERQRSELLLMASQSLFLVAVLSGMAISWRSALAMLGLLSLQWLPSALQPDNDATVMRGMLSLLYLGAAILLIVLDRKRLRALASAIAPRARKPPPYHVRHTSTMNRSGERWGAQKATAALKRD